MTENTKSNELDIRKRQIPVFIRVLNNIGIYIVIILLLIAGSFISPNFLNISNLGNTIQAVAFLGIAAAGMAFVTYSGHFADMSMPITMALAGSVTISTIRFGFVQGVICGLLAGVLIGVINAIVVGKIRANPIIWTLAVNFVVSGMMRLVYRNRQIYPDVEAAGSNAGEIFIAISRTYIFGIPLAVITMIAIIIILQFVLSSTLFGKQLKIVGSNYEVAKMSGINVTKILIITYIICALASSIAGIFITSLAKVGAYYNGEGYDFKAVTAVVLGGMTLAGGRGNLIGVLGGVLTVGLISNIMTLIGIGTFEQQIVTGIIFIFIVWLNSNSLKKAGLDNE